MKHIIAILLWILFISALFVLAYGIYYYISIQSEQTSYVTQLENSLDKDSKDVTSGDSSFHATKKKASMNGIAVLSFQTTKTKSIKKMAVNKGTSDEALSNGAGWDFNSAAPNTSGNCVLYGHRDSSFGCLKDIKIDDIIKCKTKKETRSYQVINIRIARPDAENIYDIEKNSCILEAYCAFMQSDYSTSDLQKNKTLLADARFLTLVTCHPFTFVGSSPNRCVVTAIDRSQKQ